jgi:hypothetical protein
MSAISEATRPIEKSSVVDETRAARKRVVIVGGGFAGSRRRTRCGTPMPRSS